MLQVHQFIYDSMCKERGSDIKNRTYNA